MPFYRITYTELICDKCGKQEKLLIRNSKQAREYGWAISKDYKKCYCPDCAIKVHYPSSYKWRITK